MCELSSNPGTVDTSSELQISLRATYPIPTGGNIKVTIPKKWSTDPRIIIPG